MLRLVNDTDSSADIDLVNRARNRFCADGKQAFEELVRQHELRVRNLLRHLCRDAAMADELAQDAFVIAWQKLNTLKKAAGFGAWIRRIAYREFLHMLRRRKLEERYLKEAVHADREVDELYDDRELKRWLSVCSPIEREIMLLVYAHGFTQDEIAADREIPIGTIKSHVHRAKTKIRQLLENDGALEPMGGIQHG